MLLFLLSNYCWATSTTSRANRVGVRHIYVTKWHHSAAKWRPPDTGGFVVNRFFRIFREQNRWPLSQFRPLVVKNVLCFYHRVHKTIQKLMFLRHFFGDPQVLAQGPRCSTPRRPQEASRSISRAYVGSNLASIWLLRVASAWILLGFGFGLTT